MTAWRPFLRAPRPARHSRVRAVNTLAVDGVDCPTCAAPSPTPTLAEVGG